MDSATETVAAGTLATLQHQVETLTERLEEATLDASRLLASEDVGWAKIGDELGDVIGRDAILATARLARVMVVADPLIKRAVSIRVAYLGAPAISASSGDQGGQDVNAVVQAFLDDPGNAETLTSAQACEERERERSTDGNTFHALITSPRTGRVQVRRIPLEQIHDVITDPEDASTRWLYLRSWTQRVVEQGYTGLTRTRTETRRAYYPDAAYRPASRPRTVDGIPVEWDKPIVHTEVNRPSGSRWGVPDVLAALPWARGYKEALQDWAKHNKALASIAYVASAKTRRGAAAARARIPQAATDDAGRTAIVGADNDLTAMSKTGAALDSAAAEPLAGMVAAALDVPKTMLLADPGVTGARATAETLDRPLELDRLARRRLDTDMLTTILEHVVREAVRAPAGPLRGTVKRDPDTGREVVTLTGDQELGLVVDWPDLSKIDPVALMETIVKADGMDVVPAEIVARLVMLVLGIDDVDEVIDTMRDADGTFVPPSREQAHADATAGYDDGDGRPTPAEQEESLWPSPPTP